MSKGPPDPSKPAQEEFIPEEIVEIYTDPATGCASDDARTLFSRPEGFMRPAERTLRDELLLHFWQKSCGNLTAFREATGLNERDARKAVGLANRRTVAGRTYEAQRKIAEEIALRYAKVEDLEKFGEECLATGRAALKLIQLRLKESEGINMPLQVVRTLVGVGTQLKGISRRSAAPDSELEAPAGDAERLKRKEEELENDLRLVEGRRND